MRRCYHCGKILHELPYTCRRCGHSFCSDHHLPEYHHCSRHNPQTYKGPHSFCGNCGQELSGIPYECKKCGLKLCGDCWQPENHKCLDHKNPEPEHKIRESFSEIRQDPKPRTNNIVLRNLWKKFSEQINLRNFTIISVVFILFVFLSFIPQLNNFHNVFLFIGGFGVLFFIFAYFLYAVKCWHTTHHGLALFMITIPLLASFFATSKIPETTGNILFYLFIQFCFYAILSVILLYISDKVITGIEKFLSKQTRQSHWYFLPKHSYVILGVIFISFLVVNLGSSALFSDNTNTITQSFQKIYSPNHVSSNSPSVSPVTTYQNFQIVPTLEPEIINKVDSTLGNSAPPIDIPTLERRVHELINEQRTKNGLSSLSYDSSLSAIARKHSEDMAKNNYFAHVNLQGLDPTGRGSQAGYSCYKNYGSYYTAGIAENIMQNNLYDSVTYYNGVPRYNWNSQEEIAQSTVAGWMGSPGHRQNILTSTYDREGIGVGIAADKKVYVTEDFC